MTMLQSAWWFVLLAVIANAVTLPYLEAFAAWLGSTKHATAILAGLIALTVVMFYRLVATNGQAGDIRELIVMVVASISVTQFYLSFAIKGGIPLFKSVPVLITGVVTCAVLFALLKWFHMSMDQGEALWNKIVGLAIALGGLTLAIWKF